MPPPWNTEIPEGLPSQHGMVFKEAWTAVLGEICFWDRACDSRGIIEVEDTAVFCEEYLF